MSIRIILEPSEVAKISIKSGDHLFEICAICIGPCEQIYDYLANSYREELGDCIVNGKSNYPTYSQIPYAYDGTSIGFVSKLIRTSMDEVKADWFLNFWDYESVMSSTSAPGTHTVRDTVKKLINLKKFGDIVNAT